MQMREFTEYTHLIETNSLPENEVKDVITELNYIINDCEVTVRDHEVQAHEKPYYRTKMKQAIKALNKLEHGINNK